ncbi:restriction endonuclease subunit S [Pseudoalteromonas rubra]|uniref:Restriction endonuclease subunit S n=1 Tax=Pseudoalteromonas rubra TaxID=43658 RepID=A0A5S3WL16_9GAMM|nr:restriction endonuclease subunit S [Pseudoalteromonas rubra]TMP28378.1 restriction endonuclease subunit S [Pseudoalteromonas rubra]TMP37219.1 restriction endonuclease subunit S [Pseudoalteromonas rubra]
MSFDLTTLGEIALGSDGAVDGPFGSNLKASSYTESGIPVIRGSNLSLGLDEFKSDEFVYVDDDTYIRLARSECLPQDIIFTKKGTLGQTGFVPQEPYSSYLISSNQMRLRVDPAKANPKYVYYWVSSKQAIDKIRGESEYTGVPKINLNYLKKLPISLPPLSYQNSAVKILDSLNDKIALNTQTNQTLEEMAQTIFKSWFVNFDPVKAKMNGEHPEGMDAATASLFPDKLVESELGLIPEGWEPKQLKDILELAYGKALKKTDRVEGNVPVYGSGGLTGYHNQSLVEGPGVIVGRKGTVGSVYWEPKAFFPIDTVFYVKPKAGYSLKYCHLVLQNLGLKNMNTDAAVPGLNRKNAYRLGVLTPSPVVLNKFNIIMQSFQCQIDANNVQSTNLSLLRDILLPELLSGNLLIP